MAGVFWPKKLVATNVISWARLANTICGGTVIANAASKAAAAALACMADCSAWAAVVLNHVVNGSAAAAMAVADGPLQGPLVRSAMFISTAAAVRLNSWAKTSQAAAAASNGPAPAPVYIRVELTSGGSAP